MMHPSPFNLAERKTCRICGGTDLYRYLDLGDQPPANSFIPPEAAEGEQSFPLRIVLCGDCGLSQLLDIVSSEDIFDEYLYLSSTSKALCRHYESLVAAALDAFRPPNGSLLVDIGCNDGVLLKGYPAGRFQLLGVEPSSAGKYAEQAGFEVAAIFFNEETGGKIAKSHGHAEIVTATNVFAHVDDIRSFAKGVQALLAPDGVYIIEFPYLRDMVENLYFDTIYHEHLSYLALTPLDRLFGDTGLRAFKVERTEIGASGPALRLFVCHTSAKHAVESSITEMLAEEREWGIDAPARYEEFARRVAAVKDKIVDMVGQLNREGFKVGGYCAPAKGNTLLNYLGFGPDDIVAVSDNNALKIGKVTPGSHIPIISDATFSEIDVSYALLLAWNYLDFFLENADFIKQDGKFIVPLPEPRIVP